MKLALSFAVVVGVMGIVAGCSKGEGASGTTASADTVATGDCTTDGAQGTVNAARFASSLRGADGGPGSPEDIAACKACIAGNRAGVCDNTAALSIELMGCISECFADDPDPAACIYTEGGTSCGTDDRFAADYALHYAGWETAILDACTNECQLDTGDGADAH